MLHEVVEIRTGNTMRAQDFLKENQQGVTEKVNREVVTPGFSIRRQMPNGMIIKAEANKVYANDPDPVMRDLRGVTITVFDPRAEDWHTQRYGIASVRFIARPDVDTGEWVLRPTGVEVKSEYRRQGIASAMYNFARRLGNDIAPGLAQTDQGRAFWQKGAGGVGRDIEFRDVPDEPVTPEPDPEQQIPPRRTGFLGRWQRLLMPDRTMAS